MIFLLFSVIQLHFVLQILEISNHLVITSHDKKLSRPFPDHVGGEVPEREAYRDAPAAEVGVARAGVDAVEHEWELVLCGLGVCHRVKPL